MGWKDASPSDDVAAAEWIRARLLPFRDASIGSVVPTGFDSYVRLAGHEFPQPAIDPDTASILAAHTSTPGKCWMCLWDGYGYLTGAIAVFQAHRIGDPVPPPVRPLMPRLRKTRVHMPQRDYLLFSGSVDQAAGWEDGPNICWPDDRAWIVAREIDLDYTLIGGAVDLCSDLTALGALSVSLDDKN